MAARHPKRILVVDDEELNIDVLAMHLEPEFEVIKALDGEAGLQRLATDPLPDAIILDVNMPGMDGYELCTHIKNAPRTSAIPVLFFTALDQDESLCFEVGAEDYIPKPLVPEVLHARLRTQLRLRQAQARIARLERLVAAADQQREQLERRLEKLAALLRQRSRTQTP